MKNEQWQTMKSFPDLSIKTKLNLLLALSAGMALLLAGIAFVADDVATMRKSTVQHLSAVADVLGANAVAAVTFDDPDAATEVLSSLRLEPNVRFACVYDSDGQPFAIYQRNDLSGLLQPPVVQEDGHEFTTDGTLQIFTTLSDTEAVVGTLYLQAGMEQLYANLKQDAGLAAIVVVVSLGASMLLSFRLQRVVSDPIAAVAAAAKRISDESDYSVRVPKTANDEIGTLCDEFNRMLAQIEAGQTELQKANNELEFRVEERTRQLSNTNTELSRQIAERTRTEQELRKLSGAVEHSPASVVITDAQGTIEYVNPRFTRVTGYTAQEALGRNPRILKSNRTSPEIYTQLWETITAGREWRSELENKKKNGEYYWESVSISPITNSEGVITHFVAVKEDITERKQAEEVLRQSEEKHRILFESSRDAIMTLSPPSWGFTSGNPACIALFGVRDEAELTAFPPWDLSPEHQPDGRLSADGAREMIETALQKGSHFFEWTHKTVDGREFPTDVLLTRVELGGQVLLQATVRDITERKKAEAELAELNKRLIDSSRRVGKAEIATSVLHNVGNVLNSVNVSASLVCDKLRQSGVSDLTKAVDVMEQHLDDMACYMTEDERGKHLPRFLIALSRQMAADEETILEEVQSLVKNIEHIKEIVALQQSHAGVSGLIQEASLAELLEDAIRINIASAERHGIKVEREFEEFPPVRVDRQKLLQIFVNLVSNAKYALIESDSTDRQIVVRLLRTDDGLARIEVQDNGIGIPAENMSRIFSHGFTTRKEGHGFGLHSGALAAEEMGATLTVHSDGPQTGATFVLEIPFKTAEVIPCAIEMK